MLFLLFLLLPFSSRADLTCPETSACLLVRACNPNNTEVFDVSTISPPSLPDCNEETYIWLAIEPITANRWKLIASASLLTLKGINLYFGPNRIHSVNEGTVEVNVGEKQWIFPSTPLNRTVKERNEKLYAQISMAESGMNWLSHFSGTDISINCSEWSTPPKQLASFWARLKDKTPCYIEHIRDACPDYGDCDNLHPTTKDVPCARKLWMKDAKTADNDKEWTSISEVKCSSGEWNARVASSGSLIEVEKSKLLCSAALPVPCLSQEVKNMCDDGCAKLNISRWKVTCNAKFWVNTEGTFWNDWQLMKEMRCVNGSWQWKAENGDALRPFQQQKLACIFETPQQLKTAFYVVVGVPAAIVVIVIIVIVVCCLTGKCKKNRKRRGGSSASKTEMESGEMSSLGVPIKHKKVNATWTWSRETKKLQPESSSKVSSTNQESSGEEEKEKGKKKSAPKKK